MLHRLAVEHHRQGHRRRNVPRRRSHGPGPRGSITPFRSTTPAATPRARRAKHVDQLRVRIVFGQLDQLPQDAADDDNLIVPYSRIRNGSNGGRDCASPFEGYRQHSCRVEGRRVTGRGSVARPVLSQPGRRPIPVGMFPPPAPRTRRADFRHRALQWNHAARTRGPGRDQRTGLARTWHEPRTRALVGRCIVRPVDALTTATTRVVPFACACDDVRHSCSFPGTRGTRPSATPASLLPFAIAST